MRHKKYFKKRLIDWKNEIVESNSKGLYLNDVDEEISSPDVVDQASSQTEKSVEMRTLKIQIKLLSKIEKAIKRIRGFHITLNVFFKYYCLVIHKNSCSLKM